MQEFLRTRVVIDSLIDSAKISIQNKFHAESMAQIEEARGLIPKLKELSTSDQAAIVAKRESTIEALAINAGKIKKGSAKKAPTKKAPDMSLELR